ncbi:MAG TPA: hypothetical protein VMH31_13585 [Methylomirabilota bacterium]|nr:hypothetical protein [Methylomirabilota bacterium]
MRAPLVFLLGAACGVAVMAAPHGIAHLHTAIRRTHNGGSHPAGETRAHTHAQFEFLANGVLDKVAPLFGAEKERVWAEDWNPTFLHPQPAVDQEGMVFTVDHHGHHAVWVNTQLDLKNGHIQYVYVIPEAMATVIELRLTAAGDKTRVLVSYERTALSVETDEHVLRMAEGDQRSGPDWERSVNGYLDKAGK